MNKNQLAKIGIEVFQERNPRLLKVPGVGNVMVSRGENITDVFEAIFDFGFKSGIKEGEKRKSNQIREIIKDAL